MIKKNKEKILDFWKRTTRKLEFVSLLCTVVLIAIYIKFSGVFSGIWVEDVASCTIGILLLTVAIIICRKCRIFEFVAGALISIVILVIAPNVDMGQRVVALLMLCVSTFLAVHGFLRFCNALINKPEQDSKDGEIAKERRIYNNIGLTPEGMFKKHRFKMANNKQEQIFRTYSEWEKYFKEKYTEISDERNNFRAFLYKKKRKCQITLNILDNLFLPIVVAEYSFVLGFENDNTENITILFFLLIITSIIAASCLIEYNKNLYFYDECIRLTEET